MLTMDIAGAEVGDKNHSREFPPKVVDAGYSLLCEKLTSYSTSRLFAFPLPFSLIVDKDQSHFRKRTLIALRLLNLDIEDRETLVETIYLGHPASIDATGAGLARTICKCLIGAGVEQRHLGRSFRGLCADGGIINVNLSDHLLQVFCGTDSIPTSMKSKVIWVWDGAHIIELILKHTLNKYPEIRTSKEKLASLTKFFRNPTVYEVLLRVGIASPKRLYSPKLVREMKFVAHDATIARDFISNLELYEQTLREVVNTFSNQELVEEARGFLSSLADEQWMLDVHFLVAVTRILKRFSTEFQVSYYHVKQLKYFT